MINSVSLIVPVHNEESIIGKNGLVLIEYLRSRFGEEYEFLLIDNGSIDNTMEEVRKLEREDGHTRGLHIEQRSLGEAIKLGIQQAQKKYAAFYPIDLEPEMEFIGDSVEVAIGRGADVVVGLRNFDKGSLRRPTRRVILSKAYRLATAVLLGVRLPDSQSACLYRVDTVRPLCNAISGDSLAFSAILLYLSYKHNINVIEIPVRVTSKRVSSRVKLVRDSVRTFSGIVRFRFGRVLRSGK